MKRFLIAGAIALGAMSHADATTLTLPQILALINGEIITNGNGQVTAANVRDVLTNMANSAGTYTGATSPLQYWGIDGNWSVPALPNPAPFSGNVSVAGTFSASGISTLGSVIATQISNSGSAPTVASCGTSPAVSANSTNMGGKFTTGTSAPTSCAITFATSGWATAAFCTITAANAAASGSTILPYISTQSSTGFTVTFAAGLTSGAFNYHCQGT